MTALPGQLGLFDPRDDVPRAEVIRVRKVPGLARWRVTWRYRGTHLERCFGSRREAERHATHLRLGLVDLGAGLRR